MDGEVEVGVWRVAEGELLDGWMMAFVGFVFNWVNCVHWLRGRDRGHGRGRGHCGLECGSGIGGGRRRPSIQVYRRRTNVAGGCCI